MTQEEAKEAAEAMRACGWHVWVEEARGLPVLLGAAVNGDKPLRTRTVADMTTLALMQTILVLITDLRECERETVRSGAGDGDGRGYGDGYGCGWVFGSRHPLSLGEDK